MESGDSLITMSDAIEKYGPGPDDDEVVILLQWDDMKAPNDPDMVTMIVGWHDYESVGLMPPKPAIDWYYVDDEENVYTIDDMIAGKPDWFDPPDPAPSWYDRSESKWDSYYNLQN